MMFPAAKSSTAGNKTGSWRVFRPVVNDKCIGCKLCYYSCPDDCIQITDKKAIIDYDYCKGCLICLNVCPHGAITKEMEKK
ncbi:MAG: 4Fe-4S binding protein [Candidatus Aenigmarchaeota archaeon]|nr:4Fe-4S binding protein [Candidatus Aenigmarchaeota archaeon]